MSEQEIERNKGTSDDPDVEGHRARGDEASDEQEVERRQTDEESDVEAHRQKA